MNKAPLDGGAFYWAKTKGPLSRANFVNVLKSGYTSGLRGHLIISPMPLSFDAYGFITMRSRRRGNHKNG